MWVLWLNAKIYPKSHKSIIAFHRIKNGFGKNLQFRCQERSIRSVPITNSLPIPKLYADRQPVVFPLSLDPCCIFNCYKSIFADFCDQFTFNEKGIESSHEAKLSILCY